MKNKTLVNETICTYRSQTCRTGRIEYYIIIIYVFMCRFKKVLKFLFYLFSLEGSGNKIYVAYQNKISYL